MSTYLDKVRALGCFNCWEPGPSQAHHHTARRGLSQRAKDEDSMPLCHTCHHDFHAACGAFKTWGKAQRRAFQDAGVEWTRGKLTGASSAEGHLRGPDGGDAA